MQTLEDNPSLQLEEEKKGEERCRRKLGGPGTGDNKVLSAGQLLTLRASITHHLHRDALERFQTTPAAKSFLLLGAQHYTSKTILLPGFLKHSLTDENLDGRRREAMPLWKAPKRLQARISILGGSLRYAKQLICIHFLQWNSEFFKYKVVL